MKYDVDSLATQMGLHEMEIAARKSLFGFEREDVYNLKKIRDVIYRKVDDIVHRFYENQLAEPDIKLIIGDQETLRRLMHAQRSYILSLLSGEYGTEYVNDRLRIGKVHKRIGVEPKHYMSSMKMLQKLLIETARNEIPEDKLDDVADSLDKLLAFDIALVFETYTLSLTKDLENSKCKVEAYAKDLEKIVEQRTEELAELSLQDPLTELPNRRALAEYSKRQFANASRYKEPLSIVFFDVDRFKALNDQHGHKEGDNLLITIAAILKATVREGDMGCRMGGDEFCVLLNNCPAEAAHGFADRLIGEFKKKVDPSWDTSISIGVFTRHADSMISEDQAFKYADTAMYQAKEIDGCSIHELDSQGFDKASNG